MGYLISEDEKPYILIISGENIQLKGEMFTMPESIEVVKGKENQQFGRYASEQPRREQALSAWAYLEKIYTMDSLFAVHETPQNAIELKNNVLTAKTKPFWPVWTPKVT
jgi:hypothetical protein